MVLHSHSATLYTVWAYRYCGIQMKLTPDNFVPITDNELRDLWLRYRESEVRRLILEVHRARNVLNGAHADALRAQYALWEKKDGDV